MFGLDDALLAGGALALIGGLFSGTAGLASGLSAQSSNEKMMERQLKESVRQFDENMSWQREQFNRMEQMSNTAHQREVQDLVAAGLNPILSVTGGSGASTVSSVGSPAPTAHADFKDASSALGLVMQGVNSATDAMNSTADIFSKASLNHALASEALSKAAQNKDLTQPMKDQLIQQASASAAAAGLSNAKSQNLQIMTPLQEKLALTRIAEGAANAQGMRIDNSLKHARFRNEMLTSAAQRDFQRGMLKTKQVDSAVNVVRGVTGGFRDLKGGLPFGGRGFPSTGSNWADGLVDRALGF